MAEQFYTILTKVGKAKIANASALGTKVNFSKFQVGDSNGSYYNPTEEQTELKNKVWEGNINSISVDEKNPNWIVIEILLPSNVGGFMIREAAILDDENNMIAIAKYPETYKPITSEGSSKDLLIRTILEVSNTSSVTIKVDPTVILATQKDIQVLNNKIENIKIPVKTVNNKTGDENGNIDLKTSDIKTTDGQTVETQLLDYATHKKDTSIHVTQNEKSTWNGKQNNLGFTPENSSNKGKPNGYASLGSDGKVPSTQLPSLSNGYEKIGEILLSGLKSFEFNNIPSKYMDLLLICEELVSYQEGVGPFEVTINKDRTGFYTQKDVLVGTNTDSRYLIMGNITTTPTSAILTIKGANKKTMKQLVWTTDKFYIGNYSSSLNVTSIEGKIYNFTFNNAGTAVPKVTLYGIVG